MMTREWPRANAIRDQIANLWVWLEDDPKVRFAELVDFMLPDPPKGQQIPLIEVFADGETYEDRVLDVA